MRHSPDASINTTHRIRRRNTAQHIELDGTILQDTELYPDNERTRPYLAQNYSGLLIGRCQLCGRQQDTHSNAQWPHTASLSMHAPRTLSVTIPRKSINVRSNAAWRFLAHGIDRLRYVNSKFYTNKYATQHGYRSRTEARPSQLTCSFTKMMEELYRHRRLSILANSFGRSLPSLLLWDRPGIPRTAAVLMRKRPSSILLDAGLIGSSTQGTRNTARPDVPSQRDAFHRRLFS